MISKDSIVVKYEVTSHARMVSRRAIEHSKHVDPNQTSGNIPLWISDLEVKNLLSEKDVHVEIKVTVVEP